MNKQTSTIRYRANRISFPAAFLTLTPISGLVLICLLCFASLAHGDSWATPVDRTYYSENHEFQLTVEVRKVVPGDDSNDSARGILKQRVRDGWKTIWEKPLKSQVSPTKAIVHNSGRFVVTFDEWYSIGRNPVTIYNSSGDLIKQMTLEDLGIPYGHPMISQSVSSYHWNQYAIYLFGPEPSDEERTTWRRKLESTLFIRLHWGQLLTIDLEKGKLVPEDDLPGLSNEDAKKFYEAKNQFLLTSYKALAEEWLIEDNFFPDNPQYDGIRGMLLAKELKWEASIPLLKRIAITEAFNSWSAPKWPDSGPVHRLRPFAKHVIETIEREK